MLPVDLWGLLILAATRHTRLDLSAFQDIGVRQGTKLQASILEIRKFCKKQNIPDLTLVLSSESPHNVWAHDWISQSIPGDVHTEENYSPQTWITGGVERLRRGGEAAKRASEDLVSRYWPLISEIVREKIQPLPEKFLSDTEMVEQIARRVYPLLPTLVQFIVSEKDFVRICLENAKLVLSMYSKRRGSSG